MESVSIREIRGSYLPPACKYLFCIGLPSDVSLFQPKQNSIPRIVINCRLN